MKLISAGAAQTVTGSCHLLEFSGKRILIDCGLFQGGKKIEALNREPFPFDVGSLDAVLITHGHLDHVGRLPLLIKGGYDGPIYSIYSTQKITEVILNDSAKIQSEDYERALRKAKRSGREHEVEEPLYSNHDAARVMTLFRRIEFEQKLDLGAGLSATFYPSGHILGSAFIELSSPDVRVIVSGDLGNRESNLQADARLPKECDAVIIETTYANRTHRSRERTIAEFRELIKTAVDAGGKVMIPSFALERTQNILHTIKEMQDAGELPALPIYLDSPMATRMTQLYQECKNEFVEPVKQQLERGEDPFEPEHLTYSVTTDQSKEINEIDGLAIIVAGSGMMSGGRILHHLRHNLWKRNAHLLVVGYQAEGTLGRLIIEGRPEVKIFGEEIAVRAGVNTINGFSAHADRDDLLHWLKPTGNARVYMVHGEVKVMNDFERTLHELGRDAIMVERGEIYSL